MKNELKNSENTYNYEVNKLKEKLRKENELIKDKYKQIDENNLNNYNI